MKKASTIVALFAGAAAGALGTVYTISGNGPAAGPRDTSLFPTTGQDVTRFLTLPADQSAAAVRLAGFLDPVLRRDSTILSQLVALANAVGQTQAAANLNENIEKARTHPDFVHSRDRTMAGLPDIKKVLVAEDALDYLGNFARHVRGAANYASVVSRYPEARTFLDGLENARRDLRTAQGKTQPVLSARTVTPSGRDVRIELPARRPDTRLAVPAAEAAGANILDPSRPGIYNFDIQISLQALAGWLATKNNTPNIDRLMQGHLEGARMTSGDVRTTATCTQSILRQLRAMPHYEEGVRIVGQNMRRDIARDIREAEFTANRVLQKYGNNANARCP